MHRLKAAQTMQNADTFIVFDSQDVTNEPFAGKQIHGHFGCSSRATGALPQPLP